MVDIAKIMYRNYSLKIPRKAEKDAALRQATHDRQKAKAELLERWHEKQKELKQSEG